MSEGDRRSPHEGSVASRAPGLLVEVLGGEGDLFGSDVDAAAELSQHGTGLDPDIGGARRPRNPRAGDVVFAVEQGDTVACGCLRGEQDRHGHLGVVGPLPRRPPEVAATLHRHLSVRRQRWTELIAGPKRITARQPEQHSRRAVTLRRSQRPLDTHRRHPPSPASGLAVSTDTTRRESSH